MALDEHKRRQNERKFVSWKELSDGGRHYWYEVKGQMGWRVRYVKEVDANETTFRFYQEIYNSEGKMVEIHEKYPVDKGHQPV